MSLPDVRRPLEPLWRGLLVYRVLTLVSASVVVLVSLDEYAAPAGAVGVLVAMAATSVGNQCRRVPQPFGWYSPNPSPAAPRPGRMSIRIGRREGG